LLKASRDCDRLRGVLEAAEPSAVVYSPVAHRAIIAMRTATSNRPFNMVTDKYYRMEVLMLRPNTLIPFPSTVSRDVNLLYLEIAKNVKSYFVV
ncbi:hypothetical protein K438DRAFT_1526579, partial [Mycena galopus ATCC 62051]